MDGSTDKGNTDDEVFMAVWCDSTNADEKVHTRTTYFHMCRPKTVNTAGLFQSLKSALLRFGISDIDPENGEKLVGIGSDEASTNIARGGLKGLVESQCEWIFLMWCLAHRLQLAVKDALKGTAFDAVDDMLLKLYYLYEKAAKKCRELAEVVTDLKECINVHEAGIKPIRATGSRWVSHKLDAVRRILSKYGVYTGHLLALSEDCSVKSTDWAKFHDIVTSGWMLSTY